MFEIGRKYTRNDIYRLLEVPFDKQGGNWDTGYHQYNGEWFIFCNVGIEGRTGHDYLNKWIEDDILEWYGKGNSKIDHPTTISLLNSKIIKYIFSRSANREPFTFYGYGKVLNIVDSVPIKITWKILHNKEIYPIEAYSWRIISPKIALKIVDRSVFIHNETGIPEEIRWFFNCESLNPGESINLLFIFDNIEFNAFLEMKRTDSVRSKIRWNENLSSVFKEIMPDWYTFFLKNPSYKSDEVFPQLRISKTDTLNQYEIEIIDNSSISSDICQEENNFVEVFNIEGKKVDVLSTRYERDKTLRAKAIEYHGYNCAICGFNFREKYGERGIGYIQIHHIVPLNQYSEEKVVDPRTDLIPVCSNCHSIIHRKKNDIPSIEEMKRLFES